MAEKANVLLVGGGSVWAMTAYSLEVGGKSKVTAVLRSNYEIVNKDGFTIDSIQHGFVQGWKPTKIAELIASAVTINHTAIVLIQNGINIEKPIIAHFPGNPVISGVSLIAATRTEADHVTHNGKDRLIVGEFENASLSREKNALAAKQFVELYQASGKLLRPKREGNCTEFENVIGEPLRVAERFKVPAPYLKVAYGLLNVMQEKTKEDKGLIHLPLIPPSPLTPPEYELDSEAVKHHSPDDL